MPNPNCNSTCAGGMNAVFHIERAAMLLNAALEINNLSGAIYRNSLRVAMTSLGHAVEALQRSHSIKETVNG